MKATTKFIAGALAISLFVFFSWFLGHVFDYDEVSHRAEYTELLGERFTLVDKVIAVGVTMDQNYQGDADRIYLKEFGSSGPQVRFRQSIADGVLEIVGVHQEKWFIGAGIYYRVKYKGAQKVPELPIYVRAPGPVNSDNLGLDEALYQRIQIANS